MSHQHPRHILLRSPSEGSGLRSRPTPKGAESSAASDTHSSVLYIPTGGDDASAPTTSSSSAAAALRRDSNRSVLFLRPTTATTSTTCHRTGLQFPVNVDDSPSKRQPRQTATASAAASQPGPVVHTARLFASPRARSQTPTASPVPGRAVSGAPGSPRPMVVMNSGGGGTAVMPSITCRDNVLEIRPASGDCCVRVNASPGGKVRIKIPSTQQSSRVARFRIADSLKLYGESVEGSETWHEATSDPSPTILQGAFFDLPSAEPSVRPSGVGLRLRRQSDDAARAAARAKKRHSYAFEGDHDEALHESRIDNFVLESLSEVSDTSVKSESKIFHILANKIEKQGPEAGNLWTAFSLPELVNFLKILEIEERDMRKTVIFKYKLLKYRISKLMSAQRKLSQ